jgi:hypothetical protein
MCPNFESNFCYPSCRPTGEHATPRWWGRLRLIEPLWQATGDIAKLEEDEEDYPSMNLNLPNDVHGGTSGYPLPMVYSAQLV